MTNRASVSNLVQFTDPHLFTSPAKTMRGVNTYASFLHTLEMASSFIDSADAILLTGDIAQDEVAPTYDVMAKVTDTLGKPVWVLPGNHDNPMELCHRMDSPPFSYLGHHQQGNWEIILLDSYQPGSPAGMLGEQEIHRLKDRLSGTSAEHVLIAIHHHPIQVASAWLDNVGLQDAQEFLAAVADSKLVRSVCFGHVHQAFDQTINGTRFLGCPSTCAQFLPVSDDFAMDQKPPGFRWFTLHADGNIETDVVWVNSTFNDNNTISK